MLLKVNIKLLHLALAVNILQWLFLGFWGTGCISVSLRDQITMCATGLLAMFRPNSLLALLIIIQYNNYTWFIYRPPTPSPVIKCLRRAYVTSTAEDLGQSPNGSHPSPPFNISLILILLWAEFLCKHGIWHVATLFPPLLKPVWPFAFRQRFSTRWFLHNQQSATRIIAIKTTTNKQRVNDTQFI